MLSSKTLQTLNSLAELAVEAVVKKLKLTKLLADKEVSVVMADNKTIKALNNVYRGKNYATNVLSFPYIKFRKGEMMEKRSLTNVVGEMVISLEKCAEEAEEQNKTLNDHLVHLTIHSMLHLLGYDHEKSKKEAAEMERLEIDILKNSFKIKNPYLI